MSIPVERRIEQVSDGSRYKGHVIIAGIKFDYEMVFGVPIPQLDSVEPDRLRKEIRSIFQITVKKNGADIELVGDEYGFWFHMLAEAVVRFYNEPMTRERNDGPVGQVVDVMAAAVGGSAWLESTSQISCDFPSDICKMLAAPKFACTLPA